MSFISYLQEYLNDPNSLIWSTTYLNQLALEAEQEINKDLQCIYFKFYLATTITPPTSVYTLPSYVRSILRVTWRGRRLDPVNWEDLQNLAPATVWISPGNAANVEYSIGIPLYYALHPTNPFDIRLYPCPDLACSGSGDPTGPQNPYMPGVYNECIVSCWRSIDTTLSNPLLMLPSYVDQRTRKAYCLWKAYESEGKGQNSRAAAYYKQRYQMLIENFQVINQVPFIAQRYSIDDGMLQVEGFRMPKPILPSNFERVFYR